MASSVGQKSSGATSVCRSSDLLGISPPSYMVSADILKADSYPYTPVLAQSEGCCWQKSYSVGLVLSSLLPISIPSDNPFLHGPGAHSESYGCWNRQLSYFHSRHRPVVRQYILSSVCLLVFLLYTYVHFVS